MRALRKRVDPCIRATSSVHAHLLAANEPKRRLHVILNPVPIRLALPAGERRAIISDD